jgi:Fe-S-cluster containining protein
MAGESGYSIETGTDRFWDFRQVAEMVIYQRPHESGEGYMYTCKHFDEETNNCTNYENRPRMCRDYPYGGVCSYEGCTMSKEEQEMTGQKFSC